MMPVSASKSMKWWNCVVMSGSTEAGDFEMNGEQRPSQTSFTLGGGGRPAEKTSAMPGSRGQYIVVAVSHALGN